jgi:hypothetical protein
MRRQRAVYLTPAAGKTDVPVFDGPKLGARAKAAGPAVIAEPTTMSRLLAFQRAAVDNAGNPLVKASAT